MGIFDLFKKTIPSGGDHTSKAQYTHPTLGAMEDNDGGWFSQSVQIPIFETPITVSLIGGEDGPCGDALQGYFYVLENWEEIIKSYGIYEAFYEMHEAYADGMGLELVERAKFWATVEPQHLVVSSKDTLSFTVTFTWQDPNDGHQITAEIEDGECVGCPVDG